MSQTIEKEVKEPILARIKNDGIPAAQVARKHGVSDKTVYTINALFFIHTSIDLLSLKASTA